MKSEYALSNRSAIIMTFIMSINCSKSGIFSLLAVFFALPEPIALSINYAITHSWISESGINGDFILVPPLIAI
jgi:hypothetical protein